MHAEAFAYIQAALPDGAAGLVVAEFGSRNVNGSVRDVASKASRYVGVDIEPGPDVDVVADAGTVDLEPDRFDVVVCAEVFEHADDQACQAMVHNAWRMLKPGGTFIATMAGLNRNPHSAVDGGPLRPGEFYRNVGCGLLAGWLAGAGFTFTLDNLGADLRCTAHK